MSKSQSDRRDQREFLYVFDSNSSKRQASDKKQENEPTLSSGRLSLSSDQAKEARRKLIDELHELGC